VKMKNHAKGILAVVVAVLLLAVLAACEKTGPETMLQPPVEGLTWGMTQEEALEALGLEKESIYIASDGGNVWWLTPEQAGLEKAELDGLALYGKEPHVEVYFTDYAGVERLSQVMTIVQAEGGPALREALTNVYGEPYEGDWAVWSGTDLEKKASKTDVAKLDEYDLGMAKQMAGGEQKLFVVRPYITVDYFRFEDRNGPVLLSDASSFLVRYRADMYLRSLYGSPPLPENKPSLVVPALYVTMGMSRESLGELAGYTAEEMEQKYRDSVLISYDEMGLDSPEFLTFEIIHNPDGNEPRELIAYFDEHDGYLCCLQGYVTAESEEALQAGLTELFGEPTEVEGELRWYGYDANDPTIVSQVDNYATYRVSETVLSSGPVYVLDVVYDYGFDYGPWR